MTVKEEEEDGDAEREGEGRERRWRYLGPPKTSSKKIPASSSNPIFLPTFDL